MICTIRPWRLSDAQDLAAVLSDKAVLNNLRDGLPYPYTKRDAEAYINAMQEADPQSTFARAVCLDDRAVGSIGAFRQGNIHARTAEIGYYLARNCWGRGLMTDALLQLCEMLFAETDLLRLFAEPFAFNTGSRRVLEKAGFSLEGILRSRAIKNGMVVDTALYARTKPVTPYAVRRLTSGEITAAQALIREGIPAFDTSAYTAEGAAFFCSAPDDPARLRELSFYGAFAGDSLIGVLGLRAPQHIGHFCVRADWQRKGVGRALFAAARREYDRQVFTVNAAPTAVEAFRRLGFVPAGPEFSAHGLLRLPMRYGGVSLS